MIIFSLSSKEGFFVVKKFCLYFKFIFPTPYITSEKQILYEAFFHFKEKTISLEMFRSVYVETFFFFFYYSLLLYT